MNKYKVKKIAWKNVGLQRAAIFYCFVARSHLRVKDVKKGDEIHKCDLTVKMAHLCMIRLAYEILPFSKNLS